MPAVDRNVLRIGVFELLYVDDVPDAVAVTEAMQPGARPVHRRVAGVRQRRARQHRPRQGDAHRLSGIMGDVRLVAVLLLTVLVAGCADDAKPASGSSSSPSRAASSEPGGATTKAAGCTPRPQVTVAQARADGALLAPVHGRARPPQARRAGRDALHLPRDRARRLRHATPARRARPWADRRRAGEGAAGLTRARRLAWPGLGRAQHRRDAPPLSGVRRSDRLPRRLERRHLWPAARAAQRLGGGDRPRARGCRALPRATDHRPACAGPPG